MLSHEEKAKELVSKFRAELYRGVLTQANVDPVRDASRDEEAKPFALIHAEEIMTFITAMPKQDATRSFRAAQLEYWIKVQESINNL